MRVFIAILLLIAAAGPALAQREVGFASAADPSGALIVAVDDAADLSALEALIGEDGAADAARAIAAAGFAAEEGATASFVSGRERYGAVHLVAVEKDGMRSRDWEDFGGRAAVLAKTSKTADFYVVAPGADRAALESAATGAMLGGYAFDKYFSEKPAGGGRLLFVTPDADAAAASFDRRGRALAEAVAWTRDMQSEPANALYPEEFVRRARDAFSGVPNISMAVFDERQMERLGMGAILGVGQGSVRPPRMMIVRYQGGGDDAPPIVFAGKGITFDSGGVSIKKNDGMWAMKADMTGAAAVMGAAMSLAKSGAPVNVVAIAALAENMPDGGAQRPGDVVRAMSGKTIEIMSTDAEGRLVLADAIWYAQERYEPALLVDLATLTGSVGRALGDEYAGLFTRDDAIADALLAAGDAAGEDLWRLPLHPNHDKQIKSLIADVKNANTGDPGASTGAAFIGTFVRSETPWAHLDIAGVDWRTEPTPTMPVGASGFGVRLLDQLARGWAAAGD